MAEPANNIRVAHFVQGFGLVLKILDQRLVKLRVGRALKARIQGFDYDRLAAARLIVGQKYLGIAAAAQAPLNEVPVIDYAVLQPQFRHLNHPQEKFANAAKRSSSPPHRGAA